MTKPKVKFLIIFALVIAVLNIAPYTWNQSLKVFDVQYLVNTPVDRVAFDQQGQVWVFGDGKLSVYEDGVPVQSFTAKDSPALGGNLWELEVDNKGRTWVATQGYERTVDLAVFDGTKWSTIIPKSGSVNNNRALGIYSLAIDSKGRAWVSVENEGLYIIDGNLWENHTVANSDLLADTVDAIAFDGQGRAWIGSGGLNIFDGKVWQTFNSKNSPLSGGVDAIVFDQQGWAWMTSGEGVNAFDGKSWISYPNLSAEGFLDIAVDGHGRVWAMQAFGKGTMVFDGKSWKNHKFPVNDIGANLTTDENGNIWILTKKNGVTFIPSDSQKYLSPLANMISLAIASHGLIYLDIFLFGIWLYFAITAWRSTGLGLADLRSYFVLSKERVIKQLIPSQIMVRDFVIGFLGWWAINYVLWKIIGDIVGSSDQFLSILIFVCPAINIATMVVLVFSKRWKATGLGILAAIGVNFVIVLALGAPAIFLGIPFTFFNIK